MSRMLGAALGVGLCAVSLIGCGPYPVSLGPVGGPNGNPFNDRTDNPTGDANSRLVEIRISKSKVILGLPTLTDIIHFIQNVYVDPSGIVFEGVKHGGGTNGCCETFVPPLINFKEGQFLIGICGRAAKFVDAIAFITNEYQVDVCVDRAFGGEGGNEFYLFAPPGYKIRQFFGRSGAALDAIGIIAEAEPKLVQAQVSSYPLGASGGWGGNPFADPPVDQAVRVDQIIITESCYVNTIQLVYTINGMPAGQTAEHGGGGNCPFPPPDPIILPQVFKLAADEHLIGVQGYTGTLIDRLEIVTNKRVLGPFGASTEGQRFSLVAPQGYKVRRLFGRSGGFIDSVGIIVERDS